MAPHEGASAGIFPDAGPTRRLLRCSLRAESLREPQVVVVTKLIDLNKGLGEEKKVGISGQEGSATVQQTTARVFR